MNKFSCVHAALVISLFFSVSCKDKEKVSDKSTSQVADADTTTKVKPTAHSTGATIASEEKATTCFQNSGLKYETTVTLTIDKKKVEGTVSSRALDGGKSEEVAFEGTIADGMIVVKFKADAPMIGESSEWTKDPWKIVHSSADASLSGAAASEKLIIPFNAKNFDTNKWQKKEYIFDLVKCK